MTEQINIPSAWLERLPSPAPTAWFAEFQRAPLAALDALLWESMYLDHDHPREREDLLSNWATLIGDEEGFATRLDQGLAGWINVNWGKLHADTSAAFHARVWSAAISTVHLCSPNMPIAAQALLEHFPQRVDWLGRWSAGPGQDPLGAMLLAVTGYQTTRQLAPLWQRMVHLPDGIPVHHAGIALEGILQLPPDKDQKAGVYRNEFAHALVSLAIAFDYRAQRGDITEKIAHTLWQRLQRMAFKRIPFVQRWKDDIALMLSDKETDDWAIGGMARDWLCGAFNLDDESVDQHLFKLRKKGTIPWDGAWPIKAKELGSRLDIGESKWRSEAVQLLGDQLAYAKYTGDTHGCVRSLCRLSSRLRKIDSALAEQWARQATELEPNNPVAYSALAEAFRASGKSKLDDALLVYVECVERFPDDDVARNGLADVLKEQGRLEEAEAQYLETIERFPDDVVSRTGLADVLKEQGRPDEARFHYEHVLELDPANSYAREGIKRLDTSAAVMKNAIPPGGVYASHGVSSDSALALRQRRMARYRSMCALSKATGSAMPQLEEGSIRTDLAQAEKVFEMLAANQLNSAREILMTALDEFPNSAALLTAQARLERMEAQAAGTALSEEAKQKVLAAPTNLRARFPDLATVYWLEHGLAYHALTDGQVRLSAIADSFNHIKFIADQQVNPRDPDAMFKSNWAKGLMQLTGSFDDPRELADHLTALGHKLDVREEEPVFRRESAGRWQPLQLERQQTSYTAALIETARPDSNRQTLPPLLNS